MTLAPTLMTERLTLRRPLAAGVVCCSWGLA